MTNNEPELDLGIQNEQSSVPEVTGLFIAGQGSDTPELHVRYKKSVLVHPLTSPVTIHQIASIFNTLD